MSKITKALDKAKQELHGTGGSPQGDRNAPPPCEQADVCYTQTQVVEQASGASDAGQILSVAEDMGLTDCYALLRTQVLQRTREKGQNTIMVTSVNKGEGKTLTAINLAMSMAKEMVQSALLVDTNLRDPKVEAYLSLPSSRGLGDYLLDDIPLPELLINPGLNKLVVLPAGRPIAVSTEILGSPRMRHLVKEMKSRYPERYVIFDCPHLLGMPDALIFSSFVDHILLVIEAGKTTRGDIQKTLDLLEGKSLLGIVFNKVAKH
ncbi:MAG: Capsular exopolysaccharide [Desulfovibrionaceae bacterium]|nr:MAG: Capsular exopolysaccharide [Desulfovibrionaceae bacterium]